MKRRPPVLDATLTFVCSPLGARLTRDACGKRHENAGTPWEPGARKVKVWSAECAKCQLGAAHARGERPRHWPSGEAILEVRLVPIGALLRSQPARRRERAVRESDFELEPRA